MRILFAIATLLSLELCIAPVDPLSHGRGSHATSVAAKPIVVVVHRIKGNLEMEIHPNPLPGKDLLRVLNALHDELGSSHPVVAIVDDHAKISDLDEVAGTAGKAGFDSVHTFISHTDNGKMFEVKFGKGVPFSIDGPFQVESDNNPNQ
jgi:hypothetical protein